MKSTLDCLPCFVEHAIHMARMVSDDYVKQTEIIKRSMARISAMDMEICPPEMARTIHLILHEVTGEKDPYRKLKDESTRFALELIPRLEQDIEDSGNTFETIVRIVIAGNIIDFGADRHFRLETAYDRIHEVMTMPLDLDAVRLLEESMNEAESILYIADNCGEAVFDRFLIEPFRDKITFAVRGFPILNDITRREYAMSELDHVVKDLIDTGDFTPGVLLKHCSEEFLQEYEKADLIIAKGQGNYESLSDTDKAIFFLLRVKCKVISRRLESELGSLHVIPRNMENFMENLVAG